MEARASAHEGEVPEDTPIPETAEEHAPMLDVHVPHPTHTWNDFFIHIATISVGLLIAIGLEQTVEAVHHHRQSEELRAAIDRDAKQSIHDADAAETAQRENDRWLNERIGQVRSALDTGKGNSQSPASAWLIFQYSLRLCVEVGKSKRTLSTVASRRYTCLRRDRRADHCARVVGVKVHGSPDQAYQV